MSTVWAGLRPKSRYQVRPISAPQGVRPLRDE
jgi:hypothetical protein